MNEPNRALEERGYRVGKELGRGAYGIVFEATSSSVNIKTESVFNTPIKSEFYPATLPKKVAIKKTKHKDSDKRDGIDFSFIREIKILKELNHENILGLLDVFIINNDREKNLWIVYEYMETDLKKIIEDRMIQLSASDCKSYMFMLLSGIEYLHSNWILHRDICPGNLLISSDGILKIGDFGLAKKFGNEDQRLTPEVVTRWYRAPELLMGARYYGKPVDLWSVGCVFAEMMLRIPYFAGDTEIDQLSKIFWALGTPTEKDWQNMDLLPGYIQFTPSEGSPLTSLFRSASDDAIELLKALLTLNPNGRPSATEVLKNYNYFKLAPIKTPPEKLILHSPLKIKTEEVQMNDHHLFKSEIQEIKIKTDPMHISSPG